MPDTRNAAAETAADTRAQTLRKLGARAHQLRAATKAADHYVTAGVGDDRDTGSWLMSCALTLAADLAADIDHLARGLREAPTDAGWAQGVQRLRVRAHQLHAAAKAADHFLDQDNAEDQDTGSWLIACARGVAEKLASELDDALGNLKARPAPAEPVEDQDPALRRVTPAAQTVKPVRGAA